MADTNSTETPIQAARPRAQLTDHEVDLIRELAEDGMTYEEIAEKFAPKS